MGFRRGVKLTPSIYWFSSTPAGIGLNRSISAMRIKDINCNNEKLFNAKIRIQAPQAFIFHISCHMSYSILLIFLYFSGLQLYQYNEDDLLNLSFDCQRALTISLQINNKRLLFIDSFSLFPCLCVFMLFKSII